MRSPSPTSFITTHMSRFPSGTDYPLLRESARDPSLESTTSLPSCSPWLRTAMQAEVSAIDIRPQTIP